MNTWVSLNYDVRLHAHTQPHIYFILLLVWNIRNIKKWPLVLSLSSVRSITNSLIQTFDPFLGRWEVIGETMVCCFSINMLIIPATFWWWLELLGSNQLCAPRYQCCQTFKYVERCRVVFSVSKELKNYAWLKVLPEKVVNEGLAAFSETLT